MERSEKLFEIVEEELDGLGFELVKLDFYSRGRKRVVRLFIDEPEKGVTLDDCVRVSKAVGFVLDGEDLMKGPYNLEVSSPGINRALSKPSHFRRFEGRTARIEHLVSEGKKETLTGEIAGADDSAVTVLVGGDKIRIEMDRIVKANLHGEKWDIGEGAKKNKRQRSQRKQGKTF